MEPYLIFFTNNNCRDIIDAQSSKCLIDAIQEHHRSGARKSASPLQNPELSTSGIIRSAQICTCSDSALQENLGWSNLDEDGVGVIDEYFSHTCNDQLIDREKSTSLSEYLHSLASLLPENGAVLDVLWPVDIVKYLTLSEHLELFGALKRLVEWHSGVIYFIVSDYSDAEDIKNAYATIKEWVDLLHGIIISSDNLLKQKKSLRWRGSIDISGSQATKTLHLSGFSLEEHKAFEHEYILRAQSEDRRENAELGRCRLTEGNLEFVTAVPFHQVPTFYLTHHAYKLSVPSQSDHLAKSRRFLDKLQENQSLGFILRLRHGTEWFNDSGGKATRCRGNQQKRQKHWQNMIIESIANVTDSRPANLVCGDVSAYQFLVKADSTSSVIAYLMRDLSDFNGQIPMMIGLNDLQNGRKVEWEMNSNEGQKEALDLIASIPHFRSNSLLELECEIEKVQIGVLEAWIDQASDKGEKPTLSLAELLFLLRTTRKAACEKLLATGKYFTNREPLEPHQVPKPKPEYELDPLTHLERMALNMRHSSFACNLTKLNSNENLGGLSPPTGQILTLDASEFLRHFNADGTAVKTDGAVLRPVRSPSRRFKKNGSRDLKTESWPECLRAKDHDVYYNCEETERMEKKCERVKARLLAIETSSTCTLQQARSPPTITIIDSSSNQSVPSPAASSTGRKNKETPIQEEVEVNRPRTKRKRDSDVSLESDSKRILVERKREKLKAQQKEVDKAAQAEKLKKESRSQRHRRKLQEVVEKTLDSHGLHKDDPLYPSCVKKLFTLTMCFAKDLKTSHNLREEMEKIAEMHVEQVIQFEKRMKT